MLRALAISGAAGIVLGCVAAAMADVFPAYRNKLQGWGGGLIVGGGAVLGFSAPMI